MDSADGVNACDSITLYLGQNKKTVSLYYKDILGR
jgi:hypothetical protein